MGPTEDAASGRAACAGGSRLFRRPLLNRGVEQPEPAGEIRLDRQLALQLRLQLQLLGVVALLVLARRDERPERAALVAVDPVDGVLPTLEAERGREQLRPEAA